MKSLFSLVILTLILCLSSPSQAINFNLLNVNMGSPEGQQLAGALGKPYGYTPQQVAPAMLGPAEEVPGILQIAKSAGTVPMTVWMMRKMGFSYGKILSTLALGPASMLGSPYGSNPTAFNPAYGSTNPTWMKIADPLMVQFSRVNYLRNILKINPQYLSALPYSGAPFAQSLIHPYHPVHGTWMPPGIAKKYGLWTPPGQRKKVGWWRKGHHHKDYHHGKKHKHHAKKHKHHDEWDTKWKSKSGHHGDESFKAKGHGPNGKWEYKEERKGGKEKVEFKSKGKGKGKGGKSKTIVKHDGKSSKGSGKSVKGSGSKGKGKWK